MLSQSLLESVRNRPADDREAVVVEVLDSKGSVPREAGTRMLVDRSTVAGTIGGGHLELKAIEQARAILASGKREPLIQHVSLGASLGQCCGGALTLRFCMLDDAQIATWPTPAPRFSLQLHGAGHVGRAIASLLAGVDCKVWWIDEREDQFPSTALPPHIEKVCVEPVDAEVGAAPAGAFYLVLTHSHDLDLHIAEAILKRNDFGYFGLIGSMTKRARFLHRFKQRGIAPEAIARMTCPIGVPGITGKEPEVIAIAVVAQLLQASSNGV